MKGLDDGPDGLNDEAMSGGCSRGRKPAVRVTSETITDEMIRELRDEQEATCPVGPHWSTCVDALSDEWHEDDGRWAVEHNRERAEARARCAEVWNARGAKP